MSAFIRSLLPIALLACAEPVAAREPIDTSFDAIHRDPSLVGKRIRLDACIGVPVSSNPTDEEIVVLYPCGASQDESMAEIALVGRLASPKVAQPFKDADVSFLGEVRATLVGVLSREGVDTPGGPYHVLTIERAIAPTQFAPPPE